MAILGVDDFKSKPYILIALHKQPDSCVDVAASAFLNQFEAVKCVHMSSYFTYI